MCNIYQHALHKVQVNTLKDIRALIFLNTLIKETNNCDNTN